MQRRLSVAISAMGNPSVIFMDEPTTGMDPMNRQHVWNAITALKKNRVVILTTHSMEVRLLFSAHERKESHDVLRTLCSASSL